MSNTNLPELSAYGLRRVIADAVAEKGEDFRYVPVKNGDSHETMCRYTEPDGYGLTTSCLIGNALNRLNVSVGKLYDCEGNGADLAISKFFNASKTVLNAARRAQRTQDEGGTWGEALAKYDRVLMDAEKPLSEKGWQDVGYTTDEPVKSFQTIAAPKLSDLKLFQSDAIWQADAPVYKGVDVKPMSLINSYYNAAKAAA